MKPGQGRRHPQDGYRVSRGPRTGHAERPQPEVHPVEDDEAHGEVELAGVLGVALKVPRVLPQADLLDLPNVDCGDRGDTWGSGRLWEVGLCRNHVSFGGTLSPGEGIPMALWVLWPCVPQGRCPRSPAVACPLA